jgi:hypothetical protein
MGCNLDFGKITKTPFDTKKGDRFKTKRSILKAEGLALKAGKRRLALRLRCR